MDLKDKVAIVTGSGRGLGRALALEFSRQGAKVVCCARTKTDIDETAAIIQRDSGQCLAVQADVTDRQQVDRMVEQALTRFGRVDVLFNNAARIPVIDGLWEVDPDLWWDEVTVNLRGPMLCCRAVLPHMINMTGATEISAFRRLTAADRRHAGGVSPRCQYAKTLISRNRHPSET